MEPSKSVPCKFCRSGAHLFRDLFRRSTFGCILVAHCLTSGSLLAPVGSLLAPFGSLLAPFWLPFGSFLDPFWFSFDSVWLFCSILEFIGLPFISLLSLLICFRNLFVSFGKFWSLFFIQRRSGPAYPRVSYSTGPPRMQTSLPRPGAGILPQATEIRFWGHLGFRGAAKTDLWRDIFGLKNERGRVPF